MRKFLLSVALASAGLAAAPATAQYWSRGYDQGYHNDYRFQRGAEQRLISELDRVQERIDRAARRGRISPREAFTLQREANQIRNRLFRASRDGLHPREFEQLSFRVDRLRERFRDERRDRDGRRW